MDLPKSFDLEYFFLLWLFHVHVVAHSTEPPQQSVAAGTAVSHEVCVDCGMRGSADGVGLINDIFGYGAHGSCAHRPTITTRIPSAHPI